MPLLLMVLDICSLQYPYIEANRVKTVMLCNTLPFHIAFLQLLFHYLDFTTAYAFPAAGHWPTITTTAPVAIQAVNRFHVILRGQLTSSYYQAVDHLQGRPTNCRPRSRPLRGSTR